MELIPCVCLLQQRLSYICLLGPVSHTKSFSPFSKIDSTVACRDFARASWVCIKRSNDFSANEKPGLCRFTSNTVFCSWIYLPPAKKKGLDRKSPFELFSMRRYFAAAFRCRKPSVMSDDRIGFSSRCVTWKRLGSFSSISCSTPENANIYFPTRACRLLVCRIERGMKSDFCE